MTNAEFPARSAEIRTQSIEDNMAAIPNTNFRSFAMASGSKRWISRKALLTLCTKVTVFFRLRRKYYKQKRSLKSVARSSATSQESLIQPTSHEHSSPDDEDSNEYDALSEDEYLEKYLDGGEDEVEEEVDEAMTAVLEEIEANRQNLESLDIKSSMSILSDDICNSNLTEFLPFPRLPIELRLMIWALALPEGRTISLNIGQFRLFRQGHDILLNVTYAPSQPPYLNFPNTLSNPPKSYLSLSAASQESRTVFLEKFNHTVPIRYYYDGTRYFGSSDTIYLESVPYDLDSTAILQAVELGHKPGPFFDNVTRLALNVNAFDKNYLFGSVYPQPVDEDKISIFKFLELFGNLKLLTILGASNPWDDDYNRTMVATCENGLAQLRQNGEAYEGPVILYLKPESATREIAEFWSSQYT